MSEKIHFVVYRDLFRPGGDPRCAIERDRRPNRRHEASPLALIEINEAQAALGIIALRDAWIRAGRPGSKPRVRVKAPAVRRESLAQAAARLNVSFSNIPVVPRYETQLGSP